MLLLKRTDSRAIMPDRAHSADAGMDLYALEDVIVRPGEVIKVSTGIHIILAEGETAVFWDKSGRAAHGLTILGGLIDGPYRGELIVVVTNVNLNLLLDDINRRLNLLESGTSEEDDDCIDPRSLGQVTVPYGKAITQLVILGDVRLHEPKELSPAEYDAYAPTDRGSKGFGSTDEVGYPNGIFKGLTQPFAMNIDNKPGIPLTQAWDIADPLVKLVGGPHGGTFGPRSSKDRMWLWFDDAVCYYYNDGAFHCVTSYRSSGKQQLVPYSAPYQIYAGKFWSFDGGTYTDITSEITSRSDDTVYPMEIRTANHRYERIGDSPAYALTDNLDTFQQVDTTTALHATTAGGRTLTSVPVSNSQAFNDLVNGKTPPNVERYEAIDGPDQGKILTPGHDSYWLWTSGKDCYWFDGKGYRYVTKMYTGPNRSIPYASPYQIYQSRFWASPADDGTYLDITDSIVNTKLDSPYPQDILSEYGRFERVGFTPTYVMTLSYDTIPVISGPAKGSFLRKSEKPYRLYKGNCYRKDKQDGMDVYVLVTQNEWEKMHF